MTPQEMATHPFWGKFKARVGPVMNACVQNGGMSPQESQYIARGLQNNYQLMHNFVEGLIHRYSMMTDQQMDQEIFQWLGPFVREARMRIQQMMGGGGMGFGCGGMAGGMTFGGGGASSMFGHTGMGGNQFILTGGAGGSTNGLSFGTQTNEEPITPTVEKPAEAPKPKPQVDWKPPEIIDPQPPKELNGGVQISLAKFNLADGSIARRAIVYDPRISYVSDEDVIRKYKPACSLFDESSKKFLTVSYKQLTLLKVGRGEFIKFAQAVSTAVLKASTLEAKLRSIISTSESFIKSCTDSFEKLFLDEIDYHVKAGELCDSTHGENILSRFNSIEALLKLVTEDIDKNMLEALNSMNGFRERFEELVSNVLTYTAEMLPKIIINPTVDMTSLDDFTRILPGIWTNSDGSELQNSEDLIDIFLATRETVNGSKTSTALRNDSHLKIVLDQLDKKFTMLFLPRVVSWCNYPVSGFLAYDQNGNCKPHIFSPSQPLNDVAFFVNETLDKFELSKDVRTHWSPKTIYCECDEQTFELQYGKTTNGCIWLGSCRYWK